MLKHPKRSVPNFGFLSCRVWMCTSIRQPYYDSTHRKNVVSRKPPSIPDGKTWCTYHACARFACVRDMLQNINLCTRAL